MSEEQSYTIEEIAKRLKVSKLTVYDLVKKGELAVFRVGRQMRVDNKDLQQYIQQNKSGHTAVTTAPRNSKNKIIICGQDIVLDLLGKYVERKLNTKILRSHEGSFNGVMALYNGECDIASLHLYDGDTGEYNTPYLKKILVSHGYTLLNLVCRQAGFYVAKGNPLHIQGIADFATQPLRLINREKGSGARTLLDEQLRQHAIKPTAITGYFTEEASHIDVAAAVANGQADIGIGIEKIAKLANVDFIPLISERYDIVLLNSTENKPLLDALIEILQSAQFQAEITALGDYDTSQTGKIMYATY